MIRLMFGDCIDEMSKISSNSIDLIVSDLPYGVTANKWDLLIPLDLLWAEFLRIAKNNTAFVFTATQPFATALIKSQEKNFRYDIVWEKSVASGYVHARTQPLRCHESLLIFSKAHSSNNAKQKITYNPQMVQGKPYKTNGRGVTSSLRAHRSSATVNESGLRYPRSVLKFSADRTPMHPTQKPVALLEWIVKTYSNPQDTVLDPAMGSCTTGIACIKENRNFIGIEKDTKYFNMSQERIRTFLNHQK